jgi:plastocyanin
MRSYLVTAVCVLLVYLAVSAIGNSAQTEFVTTNYVKIGGGTYEPRNIQIKRGEMVTFEVVDPPGSPAEYGVENIKGSAERYASTVLRPGDRFNLIFERVGTFKYQDRYNRSIVGTVRVVE